MAARKARRRAGRPRLGTTPVVPAGTIARTPIATGHPFPPDGTTLWPVDPARTTLT